MKTNFIKLFFTSAIFFMAPNFASAAPSISSAPATISDGQSVTIEGAEFGEKSTPASFYFSDLENDTIGQLPAGQTTNNDYGTTQANRAYTGSRSLQYDYYAQSGIDQSDWKRNVIDFGVEGTANIYMTLWLYLDKGATNSTSWQWKNYVATSCASMYVCSPLPAFVIFEPWYSDHWWNSGNPHVYPPIGNTTSGAVSDAYLFGEWQRVEMYLQRSSSGDISDGVVMLNRVGRSSPMTSRTSVLTHNTGQPNWRYLSLSQAIESVYNGFVDFKVFQDDIYVDTTQARVELCDSATWSARTHCEIQKPTAWSDTSSTINLNQGTFTSGSNAYLYVVDENGSVNTNGHAVTLAAQSDTTAPSAPSGLSVQ